MLTLVVTPTFLPERLACSATLVRVSLSVFTPMAPLYVFEPVAKAVPPAAESVMELEAEKVVAMPATGKEAKVRGWVPMRPSFSPKYISVVFTWFNPMPSPMKKNTYLARWA